MEPSITKHSVLSETHTSIRGRAKKTPKKKGKLSPRINSLAMPKYYRPKYEKPVEVVQSGVSPKALAASASARIKEMSIPPLRTLIVNKQIYSRLPTTHPDYGNRLDKMIDKSWNSMYNCYKKARKDFAEQKEDQFEVNRKGSRVSSMSGQTTKATRKTKTGLKLNEI